MPISSFAKDHFLGNCVLAGAYAFTGMLIPYCTPAAAAVFGLSSFFGHRNILVVFEKCCSPSDPMKKAAVYATAFFGGCLFGTLVTNALGMTMSLAAGIAVHTTLFTLILIVSAAAIPCLISLAAVIGVCLLPTE